VALAASLAAQLIAGPTGASDSNFPSAVDNMPFGLNPNPKQFTVDTGPQRPNINSPSPTFVALSGIGAGQSVTQAQTLYFRSLIPMQIRLTFQGDATPKVLYVQGAVLLEFDISHPLVLLEASGSGQVEYWAAGLQ
jgi:hypothetical protein